MEVHVRRWLLVLLLFCAVVKELNCAPPKKQCPRLNLKYGRVRYRPRTFAQFSCSRGYLLLGDRYSKCTNGVWDNPTPACIKPSCKLPKPPKFGMIYPSYWNALIRFFCMPGYEVTGPQYAYCDGSQWSTHMPSCLPSNVTASVSCDFETPDICGWTHDLNHNFDWERQNFKTPSGHVGTGPKFDHTMGENGSGYYMYIESSTRTYNDKARLISPVYKKQSSNTCLEFYYHMYGSGIGELRVYMKKVNDSWTLEPEKAIFSMAGNQGDKWYEGFVQMGTIEEDFQIILEGVRGISYISDIAIDDVRLIEDCIPETTTTTFTTEDYTARTVPTFESCQDRCFVKSTNQTSRNQNTIPCDCDENCEENNSCCPDFASLCIADSSTDATEETTYEDTTLQPTTPSTRPPTPPPTIIPTKITQSTPKLTQSPTTVGRKTPPTTTPTRITTKTTRQAITTLRTSPYANTSITPATKTTWTTRTTTTWTTRTTTTPTTRKTTPITRRITSTTRKPTSTTRTTAHDRELTTRFIDDAESTTWTFHMRKYPNTIRYIDDVVPMSGTTTEEVFLVQVERNQPENPSNVGTVKVVLGLVVGVMLVLGAVFLARKVNYRRCLRRNMRHNNADSQSDVRFLTSDEMLDFTLVKPSQY